MIDRPKVIPRRVNSILGADLLRLSRGGAYNDVTISWKDASSQIVDEVAAARAEMVAAFADQQQDLADAVTMIQAQQAAMTALQTSMGTRIIEISSLQSAMSARIAEITALQTEMNSRARAIEMGNIVLTQTATVAITAGVRTLTFTVPGLLQNDKTILFPIAPLPTGYYVVAVIASAANTLQVSIQAPLLAIGATYSITCRVVVIR